MDTDRDLSHGGDMAMTATLVQPGSVPEAPYATYHGDALEIVRTWPEGVVDVTIADPPYDHATHANARSLAGGDVDAIAIDFPPIRPADLVAPILRVTRRWVILFCALEQLGAYKQAAGGAWQDGGCFVRAGIWDRLHGAPQFSGDRPAQGAEGIAILHARASGIALRWNGGGRRAVYSYPIVKGPRIHPTQKPIELMAALVGDFSEAGELVLDPFAGSMTTGSAVLKAERRFIGIERDATHYRDGVARLERVARVHATT